jgi:hypothetical protein
MDTGFAPYGMDMPYRVISYNNPIILKDLDGHEPGDWGSYDYGYYDYSWLYEDTSTQTNYVEPYNNSNLNSNSGFTFSNSTGSWIDVGFGSSVSNSFGSGYNSTSPVSAAANGRDVTYYYDGYSEIWSGGSPSWRNNNPGNLKTLGTFAYDHGAISTNGVFAIFPDYPTGYDALTSWIQSPIRSEWTLRETMHSYAPKEENNTAAYLGFLNNTTGINSTTTLGALNSLQVNSLANSIQRFEGYVPGTITPSYDMRRR